MENAPARKSHTLAWTLSLIIAVPLLYLFSVPPLIRYTRLPSPSMSGPHPPFYNPDWVIHYYQPYLRVANLPLLKSPLEVYAGWWGLHGGCQY